MKTVAAIAALALAVSLGTPLPARAAAGDGWTAGYTLGLTRTQFDGTLGDSIPQGQYGFGFGVFVSYPLTPALRFMPEVLLTTKGGTFKEPIYLTAYSTDSTVADTTYFAGDARRTMDLTYIEVPLILSLSLTKPSASFRPHVQIGVAPALRILGRFRSGNLLGTAPADPDDARRFDFGWIGGAGFDLRTRRASMRLDLRFTQGVIDVFDAGDAPPGRNQTWSLVFGITP